MAFCWYRYLAALFCICVPLACRGGGSGFNVMVVVNQNSTNSVELGNYFCEKRGVPPQNLLRISWPGANTSWAYSDFTNYLLNPILGLITSQQLTNQIDYVVLSMDIPFEVTQTGASSGDNTTTAALFYGFKPDLPAPFDYTPYGAASCNLPFASTNSYAVSEGAFRQSKPSTATTNSFLAVMITASSLAQAKGIIDQGVASDNTLPTQTVILGHSSDPVRDIRYFPLESMTVSGPATIPDTYDGAIFNTQLRGNYSMIQTNMDPPLTFSNALGYENGHYQFTITPNAFVPGAMADSLTSYGGKIFGPNDHTTLLALINAGASGAYGTVIEPCNYMEKFPSPQNYFFQSRGFSLAECYYQSVTNPYQGLVVGEPLAAPFARPGTISWTGLPTMSVLAGTTNLSLQASEANTTRPIQQVDLFVDGVFLQTITNIFPGTNNILSVTINGVSTNYTIPAGASIASVTSNLTVRLGGAAYMTVTKVHPYTHGDRIELQSIDNTKMGPQVSLAVSNSLGTGSMLATFVNASQSTFLDSPARGVRTYTITNSPQVGDFLQLVAVKTNGPSVFSVAITNSTTTTNIGPFVKAFFNAINTNASLGGADGLIADDVIVHEDFADPMYGPFHVDDHSVDFNIHSRSAGWPASQIAVRILGSATLGITTPTPSSGNLTNHLDYNVSDLYPRNHLYVTAGRTNLPATVALNTTTLPDGYHELAAVAYQGSHVRTQTRATQTVRIQNNAWTATLNTLLGGSNTAIDATLQFSVVATTNNISKIELFSTGGSLSNVLGQTSATFSVVGTNLGIGLHPFYAIVTDTNNRQYRTDTKWIRLIGPDTPFSISLTSPPKLTWAATAGRSYDILSQTDITNAFQLRATVTPTNSLGQWSETDLSSRQRFYRVRTSQ
jgi:uncharacterized protein (TIGR03790 family)